MDEIFMILKQGCGRLSASSRKAVISYIQSQEVRSGGFMDKAGKPDLYYTFFGLMSALALGMTVNVGQHKIFLKKFDIQQLNLPHFVAYTQSVKLLKAFSIPGFLRNYAAGIASFFAGNADINDLKVLMSDKSRVPMNDPCSPYSVFLSAIVTGGTDSGLSEWVRNDASEYITSSGGWSNIRKGTSPALNATVSGLMMLYLIGKPIDTHAIEWLVNQQDPSGGFFAVPGAPVPDLLSTATALLVLNICRTKARYPVTEFIQMHWRENGGFAGIFSDENSDCEYTFYGLTALGGVKS